jgi:hypothetical protein
MPFRLKMPTESPSKSAAVPPAATTATFTVCSFCDFATAAAAAVVDVAAPVALRASTNAPDAIAIRTNGVLIDFNIVFPLLFCSSVIVRKLRSFRE